MMRGPRSDYLKRGWPRESNSLACACIRTLDRIVANRSLGTTYGKGSSCVRGAETPGPWVRLETATGTSCRMQAVASVFRDGLTKTQTMAIQGNTKVSR